MTGNMKNNLKNIMYTVWANGVSTIISIVLSLLIPKVFSVSEYGMWQLYSFYIVYVGLMHLGWPDGVYLQYGGFEYRKLPKQYLSDQFWAMNLFECLLSFLVMTITIVMLDTANRVIWIGFSICFLINSARMFILLIYQATNRIKEYSKYLKLDRYIFFILTIVGIAVGVRQYQYLIVVDLFGKAIALIASISGVKDFVLLRPKVFCLQTIKDGLKNISIGSKLTLGGLATSLVIGILRQSIQTHWGIEVFAKISFTLNISNIVMIFINTIGQVLFPILRTIDESKYRDIFQSIRSLLSGVLLCILVGYFVASPLLNMWLPKYADGLKYMALLFPVYVFESKSALLYAAFFKTIRKETWVLAVNLVALIFCAVTVPLCVFYFDSLFWAVLFYVASAWLRNVISDILSSAYMNTAWMKSLFLDSIAIISFMCIAWNLNAILGAVVYIIVFGAYIILQRKEIKHALTFLVPALVRD